MKIAKQLLATVLCFAITFTAITVFASTTPSQWAQEQVNAAISQNLVPEHLQSNYTQTITRAEFCALAVRLYESVKGGIEGRIAFTDTDDVYVEKAAYIGIVLGTGEGLFSPGEPLTREQAAVILRRLLYSILGRHIYDVSITIPIIHPFHRDMDEISYWAVDAAFLLWSFGIMDGVGDYRFAPQQPFTREQGIVTAMRTLELVENEEIAEHSDVEFTLEHHSRSLWLESQWGQPLHAIVRSTYELQIFVENHVFSHWPNRMDGLEDYFLEMVDRFDDAFFEERMLVITYLETSTGMAGVVIERVTLDEDNMLYVHVGISIPEGAVTADIGNHFLIISLPYMRDVHIE